MRIPFTEEQFLGVFMQYNTAVFPFQIVILLMGFGALYLLHSKKLNRNKSIGCILGFLWLWIGVAYHIRFFTDINQAAYVFGALFITEGLLLLICAFRNKLNFSNSLSGLNMAGYILIIYGLVIYPILCLMLERELVKTIALGLPCPSSIFTLGFFMLLDEKAPKYLFIIPFAWAVIGLSAAINLGIYQDFIMIVAAVMGCISRINKRKNIAFLSS